MDDQNQPSPELKDLDVFDDDSSPTVLDLTSFQLHDISSIELPSTLTEIDLTANRLSTIDSRISHISGLKKFSIRQNLFDDAGVQPISQWHEIAGLEELVLRDNKLNKIPNVSIFRLLLVLDVSFNEIPSLEGLSKASNTLRELYVSKNDVSKMEEIDHLHELRILELGSNRLRVMENIQKLTKLEELWLGRNRIKTINLCGLSCIKKLSLQSNRLTSMLGLEGCIALEELYLSHNGITTIEGLSPLMNLRILDVSANKLTSITGIETLTKLEDLWLNDNQISSLDGIQEAVSGSKNTLTTIYLEHNPCAKSPNYPKALRDIFINVQQIDSDIFS